MILVTGATGFLGAHIVVELLKLNHNVRVTFQHEENKSKLVDLIELYKKDFSTISDVHLDWVKCDTQDLTEVELALEGIQGVFHCAAIVSFQRKDLSKLIAVNRYGTANLVNVAMKKGIKRFLHVSSTSAIGSEKTNILREEKIEEDHWAPNEDCSNYGLSKYLSEKEVWRGQEEGLSTVIINPSVLFGPWNWDDSSMKIFRSVSEGLKYYTKGANAFVDVRDVAKAAVMLYFSDIENERYLLSGHNLKFQELFETIAQAQKVKVPTKLATSFMTGLAWRLDALRSFIMGRKPTLTKESAESSQSISKYSSEKFLKQFPEFQFTPIKETIDFAVKNKL